MKYLKLMEKRRSVREYKEKALDHRMQAEILAIAEKLPQVVEGADVKLTFYEDGQALFESLSGIAGYHGVMLTAPHYMILTAKHTTDYLNAAGYAGEWFVLNVTKLDLGTCWISTNKNEEKINAIMNLPQGEEVVGILAIGYPKQEARISNVFGNESSGLAQLKSLGYPHIQSEFVDAPQSSRLSIEDIVYMKTWGNKATIEELEQLRYAQVFFYMRLAPSSINRQPWRFLMDGDQFILAVCKDDGYDDDRMALIEAGIAMLYFEVAMHDAGYPGRWHFEELVNKYNVPEGYLLAGTYQFN